MERPWVEKYRPKTVDEVSHQQAVVEALKHTVKTGQFSNLLFYGPPGTGKTSAALAVCRQLYGQHFNQLVKEFNASDERGIDVVRSKVKDLSSYVVQHNASHPPFKMLILDEADQMTVDAQNALRRMMEVYSSNTRFILICNYVSKIIPALVSRCSQYRFSPIPIEAIKKTVQRVANEEQVQLGDKSMEVLVEVSQGDLRKATNILQSAVRLRGKKGIDPQVLHDVTGWIPQGQLNNIVNTCRHGSFDQVVNLSYSLINQAYSTNQVVYQLRKDVEKLQLDDKVLCEFLKIMARVNELLLDGASQSIALVFLLNQLWQLLQKKKN